MVTAGQPLNGPTAAGSDAAAVSCALLCSLHDTPRPLPIPKCRRNPFSSPPTHSIPPPPAGHTSTAFNLTVYTSAYLIWCWHMRLPWTPVHLSMKQQFLLDLRNVAAKLWMLVLLGVAWGIAISRIIDNQHHPSDVIGGALIGGCPASGWAPLPAQIGCFQS